MFFAAVVYIITALNSHGYYHADEHYQIIEFAGLKLGTHTPDELAWEFGAQIRPALQPTICFSTLKIMSILDISNPYTQAFFLRLLSALLALTVITFFIKKTETQFESNETTIYHLMSYFLWFIPFISVRYSSETWSGLLFLLSLTIFLGNAKNTMKPLLLGLTLGLSFLFRFQIAFAIIGFLLWLFLIRKVNIYYFLKIAFSFLTVVLLGILIDTWFYGEFVFTTWNYFYKNIIEDVASTFGVSPWFFYISQLLSFPSYFIGVPLMVSLITLVVYKPRNLYLWCIIPFLIIHSIVPHKEERFIFPIVYLFPIVLLSGYNQIKTIIKNKNFVKILNYGLAIIFITVNLIGLAAMSQKSAGIGRMEITKYIHDNCEKQQVNLIYCSWANPYNPWHSLPLKSYLETDLTDRRINDLCELNDSLIVTEAKNFLVIRKIDLAKKECASFIQHNNFVFVKQSIPEWVEWLNSKYKGFENDNILMLYKY